MASILIFIIGLVIGGLLIWLISKDEPGLVEKQIKEKEENKKKILEFFQDKKEAGNDEIREYLGIPRRSVARYLDELEKDGQIEQIGGIGRGVIYRLK